MFMVHDRRRANTNDIERSQPLAHHGQVGRVLINSPVLGESFPSVGIRIYTCTDPEPPMPGIRPSVAQRKLVWRPPNIKTACNITATDY